MTPFELACLGGFISFASTSFGALLATLAPKVGESRRMPRFSLSIDFALGLMVAASAFTLIGPAARDAGVAGRSLTEVVAAALLGAALVFGLERLLRATQYRTTGTRANGAGSTRFVLAAVLMLHNFPEGLASGAALAGLGWPGAVGILAGISLQNIPEGALMVVCLSGFGWKKRNAVLGGVGSGAVELCGGAVAGLVLAAISGILPLLLSLAGGAMMASVVLELLDSRENLWRRVRSLEFAGGFGLLAVFQYVTSL